MCSSDLAPPLSHLGNARVCAAVLPGAPLLCRPGTRLANAVTTMQAQLNIAPPTPTRHTSSFPSRTHEPQRLAPLAELNLWRTSVALQRQMGDFPHSPIRSKADQHARHTMPPFVHRRSTKDALDVSCCGGGWTGCEWTSFEVMEQNEGLDGLGRRGV